MHQFLLVTNRVAAQPTRATWQGREHLVVPVSMIKAGVLNSTGGPPGGIYYPPDVLAASAPQWSGLPVVYPGHPHVAGNRVSARGDWVKAQWGIGHLFNVTTDGRNLRAEAWLDVGKVQQKDPV